MNLIEILLTLVGHTKSDRATMMADMGVSTLVREHIENCYGDDNQLRDALDGKPMYVCQYVPVSEVFDGFREVWNEMVEGDCPFTWGDNNRSLVTASSILNHLDNTTVEVPDDFRERLENLGEMYVDLEN